MTRTKPKIFASRRSASSSAPFQDSIFAVLVIAVVTALSFLLEPLAGHAAVALLYLLAVVITALRFRRKIVFLVATCSALLWDYLFNPPQFGFVPLNLADMILFAMFFIVALAMGHLTSQLRMNEIAERTREQRTAALYELVRQAGLAPDLDSGLRAAIALTETLFNVQAALVLRRSDHSLAKTPHPASSVTLEKNEYRAATWAFDNRMPAGKFTNRLPEAEAMHLPLAARTAAMGVLSIFLPPDKALDPAETELLETFAVLIGSILERDHLLQGLKQAEILTASERLQRALLQSVSHELKTPLAAAQAGIDALERESGHKHGNPGLLREIKQAQRRLRRVIDNLLDMSRIESGVVHPKLDWCDVEELIRAATDLAADGISEHSVVVQADKGLPMVRVDQPLLEQCLCNLLLNAAANSSPGAKVSVHTEVADNQLILAVNDEGRGIPEADRQRIFDAFQRGAGALPGGTGLGLAIVDGFVRAHGGNVTASNRYPTGAEFVIAIPVETLKPETLEMVT